MPTLELTEGSVEVDGRELELSNLDKVLYPETGTTKGDVLAYYRDVSDVLLPHLRKRPLTMKRYPDGVEGRHFYEKQCPPWRPEWISTKAVWSDRKQRDVNYCVVDDLPTLLWAANLAELDLDAVVKSSGSKGLHLHVPLNTKTSYEETKPFARTLARWLEGEHGDLVVSRMTKSLRKGKVFVDWSQNTAHKSTVVPFSLRARERPTVAVPVSWDEVGAAASGSADVEDLRWDASAVLDRLDERAGLAQPLLDKEQQLRQP